MAHKNGKRGRLGGSESYFSTRQSCGSADGNKRSSTLEAKDEIAVGVAYEGSRPPTVTVSGRNELARKMKQIARRFGIPIKRDPHLSQSLSGLADDEEIPQELYEPVAELLISLEEEEE